MLVAAGLAAALAPPSSVLAGVLGRNLGLVAGTTMIAGTVAKSADGPRL